jgi:multidrug efflux pump subunit AcrB
VSPSQQDHFSHYAVGVSLNNLSLFGLVLAVGIVVDDAIVVVENVERNLERGMTHGASCRTRIGDAARTEVSVTKDRAFANNTNRRGETMNHG